MVLWQILQGNAYNFEGLQKSNILSEQNLLKLMGKKIDKRGETRLQDYQKRSPDIASGQNTY